MEQIKATLLTACLITGFFADTRLMAGNNDAFGPSFWKHWSDGRAEIAGYDLTTPRYGALRKGIAVAIFVTEPFSNSLRVKADPGKHPKSDEFQVMKLNLARDYPTGIYDYNVMTSAFVGLENFGSRGAGSAAKISFSAQEWCGHAYDQLLFRDEAIDRSFHSYFDGEADRQEKLREPANGVSEDVLFLWARGFARPFLAPGESNKGRLLLSLMDARLKHTPLNWKEAEFSRAKEIAAVETAAGKFRVRIMKVFVNDGKTWTFFIEDEPPHRIIKWETNEGEVGTLLRSERLAYWEMNGERFRSDVKKLGLNQRPPRTP